MAKKNHITDSQEECRVLQLIPYSCTVSLVKLSYVSYVQWRPTLPCLQVPLVEVKFIKFDDRSAEPRGTKRYIQMILACTKVYTTLPKTKIFAPKNGGFPSSESPNFLGAPIFRGELLVSGRVPVISCLKKPFQLGAFSTAKNRGHREGS